MSPRTRLLPCILATLLPGSLLAQAIPLGTPVTFNVPGSAFANGLYVDVPANAGALRIELDGLTAGRDVDLVVRRGTPFTASDTPDPDAIFDQSQYRSASSGGDEFVVVTPSGVQPLQAGRWYVGVFNFSGSPAEVRVDATIHDAAPVVPIEVVYTDATTDGDDPCDIAPWSNANRKAAMDRAAQLLTEQLQPIVPIRLKACWNSTEENVLAYAGPTEVFLHDTGLGSHMPFLPERYSWHASAAAAQRAGTSMCRFRGGSCDNVYDIRATFGSDANFYYGLDRQSPAGQSNFISTAMHEITHGLGFYSLVDTETGVRETFRDPYSANASWNPGDGAKSLLDLTDAQRQQAVTSNNLRFVGENLRLGNGGQSVKLYAPAQVNKGSTLSHLDTLTQRNELMAHSISSSAPHDLGLALGVLYDVGWDPAPKAAPQFTLPASGQYYDPESTGHGLGLYKVAGTENFYFAAVYTYAANGSPEFYVAGGHMVDGVFVPERNQFGDSLVRSLYVNGTPSDDSTAAFNGHIRLDFSEAAKSPACADGRADRALSGTAAVMTYTLPGDQSEQWCLQPILENPAVANDLTSIWYDPSDPGWGVSSLSFPGPNGDGLALLIYYPDAAGKPRWALMQAEDYAVGGTYPLYQVAGFCRTCPAPATQELQQIGEITVDLVSADASSTANRLSFSITYPGTEGGTFVRDTTVVSGAGDD